MISTKPLKKRSIVRHILKILLSIFIVLLVLLRLEIIGQPMMNMSFRYSDKKIKKLFQGEDLQPEIHYINFENHRLRYLTLISDPKKPFVVFIHGAPGSSADYLSYFRDEKLYGSVNILDVDRPGYGYSDFGHAETSLQKQAKAIQFIIEKTTNSKLITLVGHSFGGPIAVRMAMDFPDAYANLILLAPALDPNHEKQFKIGQLAMVQPTRWLTPPALRVAADEKFTHVEELKKMLPLYDHIKIPVIHIHGTKDSLVPYENLEFSKHHISSNLLQTISLENVDHFLPWTHHDFIVDKILKLASSD